MPGLDGETTAPCRCPGRRAPEPIHCPRMAGTLPWRANARAHGCRPIRLETRARALIGRNPERSHLTKPGQEVALERQATGACFKKEQTPPSISPAESEKH